MNQAKRVLAVTSITHGASDGLLLAGAAFLLPLIAAEFIELSKATIGLLPLAIFLTGAIFQPFAGYLADRVGRKKMLLLGFASTAIALATMGIAPTFVVLIALGGIAGIASGFFHPVSMKVISENYPEKRGKAFGFFNFGGLLGYWLIPLTFGFIGTIIGWRSATFLMLIPGAIVSLLIYRFVKEPRKTEKVVNPLRAVLSLNRPLILLVAITALFHLGLTGAIVWAPTFFLEREGNLSLAVLFGSLILAPAIFSQIPAGYLSDRIGRKSTIVLATGLGALFLYLFSTTGGAVSLAFLILFSFIANATFPAFTALMFDSAPPNIGTSTVGFVHGAGMAMGALAAPAAGYFADFAGFTTTYSILAGFIGASAALSMFLPSFRRIPAALPLNSKQSSSKPFTPC